MTQAGDPRWAMRRAAEDRPGAGGARAARPPVGAPRPDPAAGRRPLPAQPPARAHSGSRGGDSQATSLTLDLAPDVFVMRVLLEETGEMFRVTNCRADMTVLELKKELDLMAGIPLNLQRLQYLDQGGPRAPPSLATWTPSTLGAQSPYETCGPGRGACPRESPPSSKQTPDGKANPGHLGTTQPQTEEFTVALRSQGETPLHKQCCRD